MSACGNVAEEKEQAQIIEKNDKNQAIENNDKNQTVEKNDKTQTTEKNDKTQTSEKNHDAHKEKPTSANTQKPVTSISPKDDPGMRVMVIDDGFNLDAPVFKDKILKQYTLICEEKGKTQSEEIGATQESTEEEKFSKLKSEYMKSFDSNTCHLIQKLIQVKNPELAKFGEYRDQWNSEINQKTIQDNISADENLIGIFNSIDLVPHHGTSTASVISYKNPETKLVLLQISLGNPGSTQQPACIDQGEIDRTIRVLKDPEFRNLYINTPESPIDRQLYEVVEKHKIKLINYSAGPMPRALIEAENIKMGCPHVSLFEYYQELALLDKEKDEAKKSKEPRAFPEPLFIQAAGNESTELNSAADSRNCPFIKDSILLIGSNDKPDQKSNFSNFGDCVDIYTIGKNIISSSPYGFLNIRSGTSFSTPLITRYISLNFTYSTKNAEIKKRLLELRDSNKYLPNSFPPELAIEDKKSKIDGFNLAPTISNGPIPRITPAYLKLRGIISNLK